VKERNQMRKLKLYLKNSQDQLSLKRKRNMRRIMRRSMKKCLKKSYAQKAQKLQRSMMTPRWHSFKECKKSKRLFLEGLLEGRNLRRKRRRGQQLLSMFMECIKVE
jgi:hypothetical protein